MIKLDSIDRDIVKSLMRDGRKSSAAVARELDLVDRTVQYRIDRLIKSGAVEIVALVVPQALNYNIIVDIHCQVDISRINEVAETVAQFEEVGYVGCSTGDQDVSLQAYFESTAKMYEFLTEKLGKLEGIRHTRTAVVPRVVKSIVDWTIPSERIIPPDEE
ncbi:MAG: Lrp/AsnC family transcriptional regulator [Anaerolineales bacterium]|nr:Lrp/AsnC family transcriptional regulator [Anaerolineales bacterium]